MLTLTQLLRIVAGSSLLPGQLNLRIDCGHDGAGVDHAMRKEASFDPHTGVLPKRLWINLLFHELVPLYAVR